jgi:hypothetical protein
MTSPAHYRFSSVRLRGICARLRAVVGEEKHGCHVGIVRLIASVGVFLGALDSEILPIA